MVASGLLVWGSAEHGGQPPRSGAVTPAPHTLPAPPQGRVGYLAGTTVGSYPEGIAFDPSNGFLYVTNHVYGVPQSSSCASAPGLSTVTIISGSNDTIMGTVVVGKAAAGIVYDPSANEVYVANCGSNNVSVINALTNSIHGSFGVGTAPMGVAYLTGIGAVAVANSGSNNVSLCSGLSVLSSYPVGTEPQFLAFDVAHTLLDVTNFGSSNVTSYNTGNAAKSSIPVGTEPEGIDYNPVLKHIYTANFGSGNVSIISGTQVLANPAVGVEPWGVVFDAGTNAVYVTDSIGGNVSVLQNDKIVASIEPFTTQPSYALSLFGAAFDSLTNDLYFVNQGTNPGQVLVLAGATGLPGVGVSLGAVTNAPLGGAADASGALYLPNEAGSNLTILQHPGEVGVRPLSVGVGLHPHAAVFDPIRGEVFVTNTGSDNVSILSSTGFNVVGSVAVGSSPRAIAYDPTNGQIDVANFGDGTVSVISDTQNAVLATISVGLAPTGIAVSNGFVFVVNSGSDSMTEIDGSNNTAFASYGTGANPQAIVSDNGVGYIANLGSDNVTEFSSGAPAIRSYSTLPAGSTFDGITAADGYVYVVEPSLKEVAVLSEDLAQPSYGLYGTIGWIRTPTTPATVNFDAVTGDIYVAFGSASKSLSAFITRGNAIESVLTGVGSGGTTSATFDPLNGEIYVTESMVNKVAAYTPGVLTPKLIPVGSFPINAAYDSGDHELYVVNGGSSNVSIIGTSNTVVKNLRVGTGPHAAAFDPVTGYVFVANSGTNNVSVLSGSSVKYTLAVGISPLGIAYDPVTNLIYVANYGGANLTEISGASTPSVVGSVAVGPFPSNVAIDPGSGTVYVGYFTSADNLTLITTTGAHLSIIVPIQEASGLIWDNGTSSLFVTGERYSTGYGEVAVLTGGNIVRTFDWREIGNGNGAWDPLTGDIYLVENQYLDVAVIATGL
jgi:YVTN family beta-propeller protein